MGVKPRFRVYFYRTRKGVCQACDYARAMDIHHQAKAKRWFQALSELGEELPEEYGKHLRGGIWELRVIIGHHQHRFLYFFQNNVIVVTNAFLKKSRDVPEVEIERSKKAMADWTAQKHGEKI